MDESAPNSAFNPGPVDRRDVLRLVGLAGLAGLLAGCQSQSAIPDPVWPNDLQVTRPPTAPPIPVPPRPMPQPGPVPGDVVTVPDGVIRRLQWTRSGIARPRDINPLGRVSRITVHHEGVTPFSATGQDMVAARLEQVRRAHVNGNGWADIGYHYIIDPAGRVWEGRSIRFQGAHVSGQNENNIGVMCLGNYELQSPTSQTTTRLDRLLGDLMRQYRVPINRVFTHRELDKTACPGASLQRYMNTTRARGGRLAIALADTDLVSTLA